MARTVKSVKQSSAPLLWAYIELLKPTVMSLAIFTAAISMVLCNKDLSRMSLVLGVTLIAIGAGAAGCLNMWYEYPRDSLMKRTQNRPIPAGIIQPWQALIWGIFLANISVVGLFQFFNVQAALWMLFTIFYYVVFYTMFLKLKTDQSIVIGGLAGALPPIIGEATVSYGSISFESIWMCALIFMWTPAHFWSLSLECFKDYIKANFPIRPHTVGIETTKRDIIIYTLLTVFVSILPILNHSAGWIYIVGSTILGSQFIRLSCQLKHNLKPMRFFGFSILYLFLLFLFRLIDALVTGLI